MKRLALLSALVLCGCTTLDYGITVHDEQGNQRFSVNNREAPSSTLRSIKNSLCKLYPKSTLIVKDLNTGEEMDGESPYKCP